MVAVYKIFLFVFDESSFEKPYKIILLKGLEIDFSDQKLKVYLRYDSLTYSNPSLTFFDKKTYSKWKEYLKGFSNEQKIDRYKMIRKIGKGKFSTVFLVKDKETGMLEAFK